MEILTYVIFSITWLFILGSFFPLTPFKYWIFRIFDYIRLQLIVILGAALVFVFFTPHLPGWLISTSMAGICIAIVYHSVMLAPYFPMKRNSKNIPLKAIKILTINVLQKNQSYEKLISLIREQEPDIILTLETNQVWENALAPIEKDYPNTIKVPLENRYGMHLYTRFEIVSGKTHALINKEYPSIQTLLRFADDQLFELWGLHPPPPSPTEKPTSRQKDGELMKAARLICESKYTTVVCGDFNTVCWSAISKQFAQTARVKDARLGRGFFSTFPAKYWAFRFPIDLLFHSDNVQVLSLKTLRSVDSDHLPLLATFLIQNNNQNQSDSLSKEEKDLVKENVEAAREAVKEE